MGSPQLYYTSCEHGLAGYTGYQFNAATPGVDQEVLREVERFTVYEPPRAMASEDVDRHPVNLCYSPDLGGSPVLSRVVSSGDDPSGRPGNYFAHSLLLDVADGPLPAELWGAGFWASTPVDSPDLPGLPLPPGPLDRRRTGAWLRGDRGRLLQPLLVAVDAAIEDGVPVLLVADDEAAAHWVAALSHLLPPNRARTMSFATYSGSPESTAVHVVAVPPGTDTYMLRGRFAVFNPEGDSRAPEADRLPEGNGLPDAVEPPGPDTLTVVSVILGSGVAGTPALWSRALPYASGAEGPLCDWRPVLAAASLADDSTRTTDPDLRAVRGWLPHAASWLTPGRAHDLLERLLDADTDSLHDDELVRLQGVAHRVGSGALTDRLEGVMVRRSLDGIAAGAQAPPVSPMRSEIVRKAALERASGLLDGTLGRVPPDRAVELLRWTRAGGLSLPASALAGYGRGTVTEYLAATPAGAEPDPDLVRLLRAHEPLRRGAAAGLTALPRTTLADLAAGPVGALFVEDRDGSTAVLRELRMLASGANDPLRLLRGVVALRQETRGSNAPGLPAHDLDEELLVRVWGPDHGPAAVLAVAGLVNEHTRVASGVGHWITEALVVVPAEGQETEWRRALHELSRHPLGRQLPEAGLRVIAEWRAVTEVLDRLARARGAEGPAALPAVVAEVRRAQVVVATIALRLTADRLLHWRPEHAAEALSDCGQDVFDAYCRAARTRLALPPKRGQGRQQKKPPEPDLAVKVFRTARALDSAGRGAHLRGDVLEPALRTWSKRDVGAARKAFGQGGGGHEFEVWARGLRERVGERGLLDRFRRGPRRG
ncbi:GTPase-associated protein 1-related protein [Nocardiopsis oceani]